MSKWRLAHAIETLRNQVNERWPDRDRSSDGTIGDTAHARRKSEHNPDDRGRVCAIDVTHDPDRGPDGAVVTERLRLARDPRIKYVIHAGRWFWGSGYEDREPWEWAEYDGPNPHDKHFHVSAGRDVDSAAPWEIGE